MGTYDDDENDWDEKYSDDSVPRCAICRSKLKKRIEWYEAWGYEFSREEWYCSKCGE